MTAPSTPPPKRGNRLVVLALLTLLAVGAATASVYFYLNALARDGTRITFVSPGGAAAAGADLAAEPGPAEAAAGMACRHLGTAQDVEQLAFLRKERCVARVEVTATAGPLDLSGLSYALYDGSGREVGRGPLRLSGPLGPGESREVEVADHRLAGARRVVIGK